MATPPDPLLLQIANGVRIVPLGPVVADVGVPLSFGFTPPFPATLDTVQAGDLSAIWFTKDVRFADALGPSAGTDLSTYLTDSTKVIGGQPMVDPGLTTNWPLAGNLSNVFTLPRINNEKPLPIPPPPAPPPSPDLASGIPGVLGQLAGKVPIPIEVPVSVDITWTVTKTSGGTTQDATPGIDFLAPSGMKGATLDLIFRATAGELVQGFDPIVKFGIQANVTVKALGKSSDVLVPPDPNPKPVQTPTITLAIPALLGIPTVVALFRHKKYEIDDGGKPGAVLLAVPDTALVKNAFDLAPVLETLRDTITRLQSVKANVLSGNFVTFLLGLGTLLDALNLQPWFQFQVGNAPNLFFVKFVESGWRAFPPGRPLAETANDSTSSLIVIGVPSRGVKLWGDENFEIDSNHHLFLEILTSEAMWATITDLHDVFNEPDLENKMLPPRGPLAPNVFVFRALGEDRDLNDKFTSLQFITKLTKPAPA